MAIKNKPLIVDDALGKLIVSSNEMPLPWGQQQKMVDLFMDFIEKKEQEHIKQVEKLNDQIAVLKKAIKC